jgi:mono/diheme cytochrome c family protein
MGAGAPLRFSTLHSLRRVIECGWRFAPKKQKTRGQRIALFAILLRSSGDRPLFCERTAAKTIQDKKFMRANVSSSVRLLALTAFASGCLLLYSHSASAARDGKGANPQTSAQAPTQKRTPAPPANQGSVERGRYLVEDVAMCGECHTPRDSQGNLDRSRWLEGAPIWIVPVHRDSNWANRAPALAGFQGFTDEQGEQILEKGVGPNGLPIQEPMHIYHMSHDDALAIIAYLKSLPSSYPQQ